jgi:hypothetical protein
MNIAAYRIAFLLLRTARIELAVHAYRAGEAQPQDLHVEELLPGAFVITILN